MNGQVFESQRTAFVKQLKLGKVIQMYLFVSDVQIRVAF